MYLSLEDQLWLFDRGTQSLERGEALFWERVSVFSFMGLDANKVSEHAGVEMQGLLGADIINHFDYRIDVQNESIEISEDSIEWGSHLRLMNLWVFQFLQLRLAEPSIRCFLIQV